MFVIIGLLWSIIDYYAPNRAINHKEGEVFGGEYKGCSGAIR